MPVLPEPFFFKQAFLFSNPIGIPHLSSGGRATRVPIFCNHTTGVWLVASVTDMIASKEVKHHEQEQIFHQPGRNGPVPLRTHCPRDPGALS